ncbi:molybdopterin-dependent oxidoreductase [Naumannella cuiyingiana]|uniref:DMSO/TMAO reductase YedYZ molybdopterin-dependent catalytic subunit n=1 Tax=Naumannella cuiyingiana TaxID=1347891 RepID=A0A7Z0ILI7_9ACTN|nr:DMSO/TMAO reductase YedYZ molybdopterin-dependent catalytic subunit [Naumannella cuiyingiana]
MAAAFAVAAGQLTAALVRPGAGPLTVVGATLIDAAPTPAKEFAVRTLGTADKPVLIAAVFVVLLGAAFAIGLAGPRHPRGAAAAVAALGAIPLVLALARPGATGWDAVPSLVTLVVGVAGFSLLLRRLRRSAGDDRAVAALGRERRTMLVALGVGGVLAAGGLAGSGAIGSRARGSGPGRGPLPTPTEPAPAPPPGAQLPGMTPFRTSIEDFYRVDIALVTPSRDPGDWQLTIDGMVDRPLTLSYDDLLRLPMIERDITLTCVSNEVGGPYVGTARWLGVPFTEIIERVGVQPGVDQVFSHSFDNGYTCSTPYAAVSDGRDAMIVVGMNGEVLPDKNGFPARMLVPGLFGYVSATKWLERIEFTRYDRATAYWTERGWATEAPILTQSRIDVPRSLGKLDPTAPVLAGVAWAQHRGIARVEVQIDDGPWRPARLADDAGIDLWRQWYLPFDGAPGRHRARVRATDGTGRTQPEERTGVFPDGARGWHEIQFVMPE